MLMCRLGFIISYFVIKLIEKTDISRLKKTVISSLLTGR